MAELDLEHPWVFAALLVAVWTATHVLLEVLLSDGDLRSAAVRGLLGGVVFAAVFSYFRLYART